MMLHRFAPEILRQYDIRGTVDQNLYPEDAYAIGYVFAHTLCRRRGQSAQDLSVVV